MDWNREIRGAVLGGHKDIIELLIEKGATGGMKEYEICSSRWS